MKAVEAARLIRAKLKQAGFRPVDVKDGLGVDASTASLILGGKRGIPAWHYDGIATMLGCTKAELFIPDRPINEPAGQEVGRSKTAELADLGVVLEGTERAKRPDPLRRSTDVESSSPEASPPATEVVSGLSTADYAQQLLGYALHLTETADKIEQVAKSLLRPTGSKAPSPRVTTPSRSPAAGKRGGSPARKRAKRKAS